MTPTFRGDPATTAEPVRLPSLPAHRITVTSGPTGKRLGRAWFDCSCGLTATRATYHAAEHEALVHYVDVAESMGETGWAQTARDLTGVTT